MEPPRRCRCSSISGFRHQRRFFHVNVQHGCVFSQGTDLFRFALRRHGTVFIQIGSVRNDQQTGFSGSSHQVRCRCPPEQQLRHQRMISDRLTISPELSIRSFRDPPIQPKFARNHCLREVTLADEIRDHVNFANRFGIENKQRVAQARLLFPKRAIHVRKRFCDTGCPRRAPESAHSNPDSPVEPCATINNPARSFTVTISNGKSMRVLHVCSDCRL